jgi:hypothetical protein
VEVAKSRTEATGTGRARWLMDDVVSGLEGDGKGDEAEDGEGGERERNLGATWPFIRCCAAAHRAPTGRSAWCHHHLSIFGPTDVVVVRRPAALPKHPSLALSRGYTTPRNAAGKADNGITIGAAILTWS